MQTAQPILTKRKKLGYALGIASESMLYNMYYTYFLTFLVQIVHIRPNIAGVVIFISIGWDAVTDSVIGELSDRPGVDKRKLMAKSILPLCIFFVLAWSGLGNTLFGENEAPKVIFYTLISVAIWLFYTTYTIPYYAVIAEMTEDYDERTEIRGLSSFINAFCIGLGNVLPALVGIAFIGYIHIAFLIAVLATAAGAVCVTSLKGVYTPKPVPENFVKEKGLGIGKTIAISGELMKLPPVKYFLLFVFFFLAGNSMLQSNLSYMVVNCIDMDYNTGIAIVIGVLVVTMAAFVPVVTRVCEKTDRRTACLIFITVSAAGLAVMKFFGLDVTVGSFKIAVVLTPFLLGLGLSTFWTVFYSMSYDIVELDEFVNGSNGERRESMITALPQFVQKFGSATGILAQGLILGAYGYNAAGDSGADAATFVRPAEEIVKGMENISTVIPAAVVTVALIFLLLYPMTRKRYNILTEQLKAKRAGESYGTEGLGRLIGKSK